MHLENEHVSCRVLGFHRRIAEHLGIPLTTALEGTGIDPAVVEGPGYIRWDQFAESMEQLERLLGGRPALVEIARYAHRPETYSAVGSVLKHMLDVRLLAEVTGRWAGPALFPCLQIQFAWRGPRRLFYVVEIPRELKGCAPFLAASTTLFRTLPGWLGLPDAEGEENIVSDRRAWVDLKLPRPPSLRGRFKSRLESLTSDRRLLDELVAQNEMLRAQRLALAEAKREADEQRRRAERASHAKATFVSAVSHEMRTPMNALIIATQLLAESELDDAQREHAEVVLRSSKHMTTVLEDLIVLDGIDAGNPRARDRPFNIRIRADTKGAPDAKPERIDVLLVEDDELTRKVFVLLLESLSCAVETAEHGARAIAMCSEKKYDLILMDCQMPVMGGLKATRILRAQEGPNQNACIIGLTAGTRESEPEQWQAAGMTNLLHKPLDVELLRAVLDSLPRRSALRAAERSD